MYIVGAGAVGTFLGDTLAKIGNEIVYAPRALADVTPVDADLAIVAVKAYATDDAIATLQRALPQSNAPIVCPQNGVGNEEKLAAAFGADRIVACALTIPVGLDPSGRGVATNTGGIAFAPVGTQAHNYILAAFGQAGLAVRAVEDYRAMKWSKLALNVVANASCAILNVLPERLVHLDGMFALELRMIREVTETMRTLGLSPIDLPRYPVRALQTVAGLPAPLARLVLSRRIGGARGRKPPSLLLDLRAAKSQTEVDALNGAVATTAAQYGVAAPVNTVYARILSDIAHLPALWAKYRERPEALRAEVAAEEARRAARSTIGGPDAASQRP